jgi:uncharacterized membrane protein
LLVLLLLVVVVGAWGGWAYSDGLLYGLVAVVLVLE